jgi:RNA polymerase sigma-B factor
VLAALEVAPAQHTVSLDGVPAGSPDDAVTLAERLGAEDSNLDRVEMRELLDQAMAHLNPREREIMALRFIEELPQTEVAKRLGISQMHVSRLQRAAVDHLRREMEEGTPV